MNHNNDQMTQGFVDDTLDQILRLVAQALRTKAGQRQRPVDDYDQGWFTGMADAAALVDKLANQQQRHDQ